MAEMTLAIGNKAYSSWSLRPWLAMTVAGLDFNEVVIPLYQPTTREEILRFSPSGKVPALRHGDVVVWESLAIIEYVAELFPQANLWPQARAARAHARSVASEMHGGFSALRSQLPMNVRVHRPKPSLPADVAEDVARVTALWRDCRSRFGAGGPFLFGAFGAADAMFAPVVTRFETYGVAIDDEARAYCKAVLALPAMRAWYAAAAAEPWSIAKFEAATA
jgi:glutathione S-transferase